MMDRTFMFYFKGLDIVHTGPIKHQKYNILMHVLTIKRFLNVFNGSFSGRFVVFMKRMNDQAFWLLIMPPHMDAQRPLLVTSIISHQEQCSFIAYHTNSHAVSSL